MHRFSMGELKILVSTTVIEVGVNVPNACLMIVENAERFGLSQLHQLRGRVGRGKRKSYCVLVSDAKGETARKRLETMRTTYDGYKIAEEDLALRGPGDFFRVGSGQAIRQSGGIRFRLADLCDDSDLMTQAATAARELLNSDPTLSGHPALRRTVEELFCVDSGTLS
jgi:ATP-dependent DNA helicase RecG